MEDEKFCNEVNEEFGVLEFPLKKSSHRENERSVTGKENNGSAR